MSGVESHRSSIPASSSGWNCRPSALPARNACTGVASVEARSVAPGGRSTVSECQCSTVGRVAERAQHRVLRDDVDGREADLGGGAQVQPGAEREREELHAEAHAEHGDVGVDRGREQRALGRQTGVARHVVGVHRCRP